MRTSIGSGRKKSEKRLVLEKANLIMLLNDKSIKDIAEMFDTSTSIVSKCLQNQLNEKKIGFTVLEPKEEIDISIGAWLNSPERKALRKFKY